MRFPPLSVNDAVTICLCVFVSLFVFTRVCAHADMLADALWAYQETTLPPRARTLTRMTIFKSTFGLWVDLVL